MLDLRRLRVLREVAVHGSFSAAAAELAYTPSAVSQQIAALEREAGATLVDRRARGVRLTDAGRALVRHAETIFTQLAAAEAELEAIGDARSGRVRMASFATAGSTLVPLAISGFRAQHPEVELSLAELEPEESYERLRAGELEVALTFVYADRSGETPEGIECEHLVDDPLLLVLPPGHPLAERRRLRLADLAGEPWIQPTGGCADGVARACRAVGFEPNVAFETDEYLTIQNLVAAGVGIALIPDLALVAAARGNVVVRPLGADAPVRRVRIAVAAGTHRSAATTSMIGHLHTAVEEFRTRHRPLALAS